MESPYYRDTFRSEKWASLLILQVKQYIRLISSLYAEIVGRISLCDQVTRPGMER